MGLKFDLNKFAQYPSASFCNNISSFSFSAWVRFDTITTGNKNYLFSHAGVTNQISCRKDSTTDKIRFSVTSGAVAVTKDSGSAVSAATRYHVAGTWQVNNASGIKLYLNGALDGSAGSTTTQTANYDSSDATTPIVLGGKTPTSNLGDLTLEGVHLWTGTILTASQIAALYYCGHYYLAGLPIPEICYGLWNGITQIQDLSGHGRHITSGNISSTGVSDAGMFGRWERERVGGQHPVRVTAAGPPVSGPWILGATVSFAATGAMVSGLTEGVLYDLMVRAEDQVPNESADSAVSQAIAKSSAVTHVSSRVLLRRY